MSGAPSPSPSGHAARRAGPAGALVVTAVVVALFGFATPAVAVGETPAESSDPDIAVDDGASEGEAAAQLSRGATVYGENCSGCHQPGGAGLAGQFPPLRDNPNLGDTDYLIATILQGREGEITVLGVTYDGRMPAFATLPDDDLGSLVAYIQSGFAAPAAVVPVGDVEGPVTGSLPAFASFLALVAFLLAAAVGLVVLSPRIVSANDRLSTPWLDAWLKTAVIVVGFVVFTVFVPNWAMQTETVAGLSRVAQDGVGVGLWSLGFLGGVWALWYAHREGRV